MVNIHLRITDGQWVHALSIPLKIELTDLAEDYYFTPEGNVPTSPTILYLQGIAKQGSTISSISTD